MNKSTFFLVTLVLVSSAANWILTGHLQSAIYRVERSENVMAALMVQVDQLAQATAQCDDIILQRQNAIVAEIARLNYNQQNIIAIVAPAAKDSEESE